MKMSHGFLAATVCLFAATAGCVSEPDAQPDSTDDPTEAEAANVCQATPLQVLVVGRENRFGLNGQQVALNPSIPMDRICKAVASSCKTKCATAEAAAVATGVKGFQDTDPVKLHQMGVLADTFNKALGLTTKFSDLGTDTGGGGGGGGGTAPIQCNAKLLQVVVQGKEHRFGFDGRQVALNPAIPIQNICQQVSASCKATCTTATTAAVATGIKGFSGADNAAALRQMGVLADAFNAALGNTSDFTDSPIKL
jgi:hypothetical protein